MKTHIPIGDGDGGLCGEAIDLYMLRNTCKRCLKRLDRILSAMTDEQLAKMGLRRNDDETPPESQP